MKNTLISLSIIILSLTLIKNKNQNEVIIPTDSIRFRVIASSDSELDIETKLELKDHIEKVLIDLTKNAINIDTIHNKEQTIAARYSLSEIPEHIRTKNPKERSVKRKRGNRAKT